jgi:opacity protein-like surface antigen
MTFQRTALMSSLLALPLTGFALTASAGGLAEPVVEAVPVPAPAPAPVVYAGSDWSGFYVGGQLGYADFQADPFADDTNGGTYGVHAGYNYDFGSFVLGGEIDYDVADITDSATDITVDNITRLKLRAGYDAGAFMPYLTAGAVRAETSGALAETDDGAFAGLGVDYNFSDNIRIGAEVLQHQFEDFGGSGVDIDATTIGARVSYTF